MPRNASGTYTLPSGNPVSSGTLIDATWANNTLNDIANEVTDSLSRSGEGGMLAPFRLNDGVQATPGLAFTNEPSTGMYRAGTNEAWLVAGGTQVLQFTTTGAATRFAPGAVTTPSITALGDVNTGLWFPAADTIAASTGGVERLRVDSSGNLGIGTASPTQRLHVNGSTIVPIANSYFTFDVRFGIGTPDSDGLQIFAGDYTRFGNRSAGGVFTERMRLDSSGNLGIGTTSPAYPLQVRRAGGAGSLGISIDSVGSTDRTVQYFSIQDSASGVGAGHAFYYRAPSSTTDTLGFMLDEGGNVGIGITSPSTYGGLVLVRSQNSDARVWVRNEDAGSSSRASYVVNAAGNSWSMGMGSTANNSNALTWVLDVGGGNTEHMRLTTSGNLGIGTTSPAYPLEVAGAAKIDGQIRASTGTAALPGITFHADNTLGIFRAPNVLGFSVAGTERMRLDANGNIVAGASAALATTATNGFLYVPTCAGTPTGVPTSITGMAPIVVNTTNNKLYFYSGGAWRDAGP